MGHASPASPDSDANSDEAAGMDAEALSCPFCGFGTGSEYQIMVNIYTISVFQFRR
jgi:hypothetical protein